MLYVIRVVEGKERAMADLCRKYLSTSGHEEFFVPRYVAKRRYQGAWHDLLKEVFPGYVFISTDGIETVHQQMVRMPKTMEILKKDDGIVQVCPEGEAFIKSMMDENSTIQISQGVVIGGELWITSGVLKQHKGKIRKIDRHKRLAILSVNLLGQEMLVEVGLEVIQKISVDDFLEWKKEKQENRKEEKEDGMETVLIKSGIFEGVKGKVLSEKDNMVMVGVPMMGSEARIELDRMEVE